MKILYLTSAIVFGLNAIQAMDNGGKLQNPTYKINQIQINSILQDFRPAEFSLKYSEQKKVRYCFRLGAPNAIMFSPPISIQKQGNEFRVAITYDGNGNPIYQYNTNDVILSYSFDSDKESFGGCIRSVFNNLISQEPATYSMNFYRPWEELEVTFSLNTF